mmetsp:Transcript_77380/g.171331  ORF Transcript_77380/g.171331 Transcript_77380/m.171331 type:complete len:241 (-) Transcript_77380:316-1038(-)
MLKSSGQFSADPWLRAGEFTPTVDTPAPDWLSGRERSGIVVDTSEVLSWCLNSCGSFGCNTLAGRRPAAVPPALASAASRMASRAASRKPEGEQLRLEPVPGAEGRAGAPGVCPDLAGRPKAAPGPPAGAPRLDGLEALLVQADGPMGGGGGVGEAAAGSGCKHSRVAESASSAAGSVAAGKATLPPEPPAPPSVGASPRAGAAAALRMRRPSASIAAVAACNCFAVEPPPPSVPSALGS